MLGYADEQQTADVMEDGWFNTGDIARLVDGNKVVLAGRAKRLIVTEAGKNVYPEDLEIMLERYTEVKEAGVFELDDRPAAVLSVDEENAGKVKDIVKEFNSRVSAHNHITRYAVVEEQEVIDDTELRLRVRIDEGALGNLERAASGQLRYEVVEPPREPLVQGGGLSAPPS